MSWTLSVLRVGISAAMGCALLLASAVGCAARSGEPSSPRTSSMVGTTQFAVLVGYDDKAEVVELSPVLLQVDGRKMRRFKAIPDAPTYKYPLSHYVAILSAKDLCPGGKPDNAFIGTTPCTPDQLIVALMTRPRDGEAIVAQVVVDPYGEITRIAEAE